MKRKFARVELYKKVKKARLNQKKYSTLMADIRKRKKLKRVVSDSKRGTCDYCNTLGKKLTREHLLPRCFGGKHVVIRVCRKCNQARSNSAVYPPFIRFIRDHPAIWKDAKKNAEPLCAKSYASFLKNVKRALKSKRCR